MKGKHQFSFGGNFDHVDAFQEIANSAHVPGIGFGIASGDPIGTGTTNLFTTGNFPGASQHAVEPGGGSSTPR